MAKFIVTYDVPEGGDYTKLYALLKEWKAIEGLKSTWFVTTDKKASDLNIDLFAVTPVGSKIMVTPHVPQSDWNSMAMSEAANKWLNGKT